MIRRGSQNSKIISALSTGKWLTTRALYRKCGGMILHSRVSELRKHGYEIEHEVIPGKSGALGHKYRLLNPPSPTELDAIVDPEEYTSPGIPRGAVPRDLTHRFRIYRMRYDELDLVATASTPEEVGVAIFTLGMEGVFEGSCAGLLDTHGTSEKPGKWLVDPFDTSPS